MKPIKFRFFSFGSSKLLTKQFIAVEDIIGGKELDVVGKLGCSLNKKINDKSI